MPRSLSLILIAALLAMTACGGGGGGDDESGLSGAYFHASWFGRTGSPLLTMRWGEASVDGLIVIDGGFSADGMRHSFNKNYAYALGGDGAIQLLDAAAPEDPPLALGWIRSDQQIAALMSTTGVPLMHVFLRRQGNTASDATLLGSYRRVEFRGNPSGTPHASSLYELSSSGDGSISIGEGVENINGNVTMLCPVAQIPYGIAADGSMSTAGSNAQLVGQISSDGSIAILAGNVTNGDAPLVQILLRHATSADATTLNGEYCLVGFEYNVTEGGFIGAVGTLTADGAGSYTRMQRENSGSGLSAPVTTSGVYSVQAAGRLALTPAGGSADLLQGGVSQDGRYAVLWGHNFAGANPAIYLLFKQ